MKISEYIKILEAAKEEHGDLRIMRYCFGDWRDVKNFVEVDNLMEKLGKEKKRVLERCHYFYTNVEHRKIEEKIIIIF